MVSCIDFSKNYAFVVQNEIQDMHWFNFHITILVNIMYRSNKDFDPVEHGSIILKEIHYYIYVEKEHDTFFCPTCFQITMVVYEREGLFSSTSCGVV